jgi:carboxyl-terminal processing protease
MDWDEIKEAEFEKVASVTQYMEELKKRSEQRLATDRDFEYIREDMERFRKTQEDKTVSLNEAQRLKEKQDNDDRAKARKKEVAARPPTAEKVYEITLKEVDLPGLPPPVASTNQVKAATEPPASPHAGTAKDEDEALGEDKTPAVDPTLDEARRILVDWVKLSGQANWVARVDRAKSK